MGLEDMYLEVQRDEGEDESLQVLDQIVEDTQALRVSRVLDVLE